MFIFQVWSRNMICDFVCNFFRFLFTNFLLKILEFVYLHYHLLLQFVQQNFLNDFQMKRVPFCRCQIMSKILRSFLAVGWLFTPLFSFINIFWLKREAFSEKSNEYFIFLRPIILENMKPCMVYEFNCARFFWFWILKLMSPMCSLTVSGKTAFFSHIMENQLKLW